MPDAVNATASDSVSGLALKSSQVSFTDVFHEITPTKELVPTKRKMNTINKFFKISYVLLNEGFLIVRIQTKLSLFPQLLKHN